MESDLEADIWQGLNRRVFSKNSGYVLTTPKLVPSSFSHSFKLRMVAGFVCLLATLTIRGLWLDGKGFKIDMEEENVVLGWLARGRHALGQSLMKGIKWDAILTFLLNNSLHSKEMVGASVAIHPRQITCQKIARIGCLEEFCLKKGKRSRGNSGGIHDTDQDMGNDAVIKKLGWIEEGESRKLVEKGEVFGMKGPLELRTILFQEGEDDPNGVKLNSDLKQARELSCVLGFIQQLWDTMAWSNPDFLNAIRRVFRTLQDEDDGKGRKHFPRQGESRADYKAREGAHEIHEFKGGTNPERYMEWERMIEHGLKAKRSNERKEKISSWEALKKKLRRKYVPSTYTTLSNQKRERWSVGSSISESAKNKLWLKTDPVMTNAPTQVLIDSSGDVAASMMMNASKEMLGDVSCEVNSESEVEEEEVIIDTNLVMEALLPQMMQEEADTSGKNNEMAPQPLSLEKKCSRESKQQDMPSPTLLACDDEVVSRLGVGRMVHVPKGKEGCAWSKPIKGLFTSNKECVLAAPKWGLLVPNHEHKAILGGGLKSTIINCIDHDKTQTWAVVSCVNMFGAVERDDGALHAYKGFKIDMEDENVVLGWLARGRHALGQSLMKGIKWDAILTFLLNNSLHKFNQGRWVHFLSNIEKKEMGAVIKGRVDLKLKGESKGAVWVTKTQGPIKNDWSQVNCSKEMVGASVAIHPRQITCQKIARISCLEEFCLKKGKRSRGNSGGIHDTDQDMGNDAVIKKLGWIEEGESRKLVEKGEVFGMKGPLELRTILFQEGEDDPNGVKLNSDLKQARELSCVLGFIQQLWDTMAWSNPDFLNAIRRVFRTLQDEDDGKGRKHFPRQGESRADYKAREGAHEIHEFKGGTNPERYMEWERMIEHVIELQGLDDNKSFELAILQLKGNASLWFKGLKAKRSNERKEKISSWEALKKKLRRKYVPSTYTTLSNQKRERWSVGSSISESAKNKLWLKTDPVMTNAPTQVLIDSSGDVAASMMMNASKEMLGDVSCEVNSESEVEEEEVIIDTNLVMEALLPQMMQEEADTSGKNNEMAPQPLSLEKKCSRESKQQDMPSPTLLACDDEVVSRLGVGRMVHVPKGKEGCAWSKPIKGLFTSNKECVLAAPKWWTKCVWQGLNRRVFSKNSGYVLTTPKLVPSSFSHSFKLRMVAGFLCLLATLTIRGLWLDGKGFKIDMEDENVVLGWLARGRHALGQSLMKGIKWDAILTFLLNNSLHKFNQGRWVHFLSNIEKKEMGAVIKGRVDLKLKGESKGAVWVTKTQGPIKNDWSQVNCSKEMVGASVAIHPRQITCQKIARISCLEEFCLKKGKRSRGNSGGIHDTDQDMGNDAVIKKLGWIEEGESRKLVEKGEVFGMKGPLELRTILFQEGEDDPNGVKLNSDLKQAREL
ncbi:hypothetical protein LXL04_015835 [Taraxacum kok-saghyz]